MKNILIVGAGSVGQVYGYLLNKAGHNISYLIKEKYRLALSKGFTIEKLSIFHSSEKFYFSNFEIKTDNDAISNYDYIILTIGSHSLDPKWLADFNQKLMNSKLPPILISLQPGERDISTLRSYLPTFSIIPSTITLIAYNNENQVSYWIPLLLKTPFWGPSEILQSTINLFNHTEIKRYAPKNELHSFSQQLPNNLLGVLILFLQKNNWNFDSLKAKNNALFINSLEEAFDIISKKYHADLWWKFVLKNSFLYFYLFWILKKIAPFNLEKYLQDHFTKVMPQMLLNMKIFIDDGKQLNQKTQSLESLI